MSFVKKINGTLPDAVLAEDKQITLRRNGEGEGYESLITGNQNILILGAAGQAGGYVTHDIQDLSGRNAVLTDHPARPDVTAVNFTGLDVGDLNAVEKFCKENNSPVRVTFVPFLPAKAQAEPEPAQKINVG